MKRNLAIGCTLLGAAVIGVVIYFATQGNQQPIPEPKPDPKAKNGSDGNTTTTVPERIVVHIVERHTDSFPDRLLDLPIVGPAPPFHWHGEGVTLDMSLADELDPAKLRAAGLTLGSPKVPLSKCQVLVQHSIVFEGKGRVAGEQHFHAFEKLPAQIAFPKAISGERFEHAEERTGELFAVAVQTVRCLPADEVHLSPGKDAKHLTVRYADQSKELPTGMSAELVQAERDIAVVELPLIGLVKGTKERIELSPRVEHGKIRFGSKLSVEWVGNLSAKTAAGLKEVEP